MENLFEFDLASEIDKHNVFMSTIRDMGFTLADPMDDLLDFDRAFNNVLRPSAKSDTDDLTVGGIGNFTPTYGYMDKFYYNPYAEWINVILMPALIWASAMAILGGPWEAIRHLINNGYNSTSSNYLLMQIKAMWWGPV